MTTGRTVLVTATYSFLNQPDTSEKGNSSEVLDELFAVIQNSVVGKIGIKELMS
jgi:hypothetical protein